MKATLLLTAAQSGARRIPMGLVVAAALFLLQNATANPTTVNLGTASSFAVLAGSTVTSTGNTIVNGDLGLYPGTSVTGFPAGVVNGTMHVADAVAQQAQTDLLAAYNAAAGLAPTGGTLTGQDLGGLTLTPGVYFFASSAQITGQLTLDAQGLSDPVSVFQIGSTLTTASGPNASSVVLVNGAQACHVFWVVGSSATLGTSSDFVGNILAVTSITADTGATVDGRLLAENGAVTLDNNTITEAICNAGSSVPDGGSTLLLLGFGVLSLLAFVEVGGRTMILNQNRRAIY